jgi:hypothetical protein
MSQETKGQQNRKNIRQAIEQSLPKYCPNMPSKMANLIAYDFNLSPDTVRYCYLPMFVDAGILEYTQSGELDLTAKGIGLQTTEDGLTEEDLQQELNEENENRGKLGKPRISLQEWKKMRSKRKKPLEP